MSHVRRLDSDLVKQVSGRGGSLHALWLLPVYVDAGGEVMGDGTWDGGGVRSRSVGDDAGLRLALLVLGHHVNLVLGVPVQAAQRHVLAVVGNADFRFPVGYVLLGKEMQKKSRGWLNHWDCSLSQK